MKNRSQKLPYCYYPLKRYNPQIGFPKKKNVKFFQNKNNFVPHCMSSNTFCNEIIKEMNCIADTTCGKDPSWLCMQFSKAVYIKEAHP